MNPVQWKDKKKNLLSIQHRHNVSKLFPNVLKEDSAFTTAYATTRVPHSKPLERTAVACGPLLNAEFTSDLASWVTNLYWAP